MSLNGSLVGVTSHTTPLPAGEGLGEGPLSFGFETVRQKGSVRSVSSVREKSPHRAVCVSSHRVGAFYFSQNNTDEQNTQSFTETLSQPNSQSVTANRSLTPSPSPNGEGSEHRDTPTCPPNV